MSALAADTRSGYGPAATTTIVLMGVAGCGKSTVMAGLARRLGRPTAEGDDFHSPANVAKMRAGVPLTDDDRWPWLAAIAAWIGAREAAGESALVACSALKRGYRDALRRGHPSVWFVNLTADPAVLAERIGHRPGHYMPASLLGSQLETFEPLGRDEPGAAVSTEGSMSRTVDEILRLLARLKPPSTTIRP